MSVAQMPAVPVIIGPTASGKTALSLALAGLFEGVEIVSADSRQIYTGMDIGTAKPSLEERGGVPHHMIDIITPDTLFSAGEYAAMARAAIMAILERGGIPLVVGGSGFYVKALFDGLGAPTVDQELLARLQRRGEEEGFDGLYDELMRIDPEAARMHSPNNGVRTLRALCCYYQTGTLYSTFQGGESIQPAPFTPAYLGISPNRELLYDRINRRVLRMLEDGLMQETQTLRSAGYNRNAPGMKTVGYAEALSFLDGELSQPRMVELIQQSTRRYAKRQMTWFRRVEDVMWMELPDAARAGEWMKGVIDLSS